MVIDAVDDLERAGANALLKSLEEPPPQTVFLLVSHAPERLLPTIRSRCRLLRLAPLGRTDMEAALGAALPDADAAEIAALAAAGEGSPGRAMAFRGLDVPGLDQAMRAIARERRSRQPPSFSAGPEPAPQECPAALRGVSCPRAIVHRRGGAGTRGPGLAGRWKLWEQANDLPRIAVRQSLDPQATVFEMGSLLAGLRA